MKAIMWKEFRENNAWAVLAVVIMGIGNIYSCYLANNSQDFLAQWSGKAEWSLLFAPFTGGVIAAIQILPELRRDQWAFLFHRPLTASGIFAGKTAAGLAMLAIVCFLPDLATFLWLRPRLNMDLVSPEYLFTSTFVSFLGGTIFYLGAMIAALRPAHIFGSRLLSIFTALACMGLVYTAATLWQALLIALLSITVLGLSAWGCFCAKGEYRRMSPAVRVAFSVTLLIGSGTVALCLAGITGAFFPDNRDWNASSIYSRSKSTLEGDYTTFSADPQGRVLRMRWRWNPRTRTNNYSWSIAGRTVPEGELIEFPTATRPGEYSLPMQMLRVEANTVKYLTPSRYQRIHEDKNSLTFYDRGSRRIAFYSPKESRFTGYSGPAGYYDSAKQPAPEMAFFSDELLSRPEESLLWFSHDIYRVENNGRIVKHIISSPQDNLESVVPGNEGKKKVLWIMKANALEKYDYDGKLLSRTPLEPNERNSQYLGVIPVNSSKQLFWLANIQTSWMGKHTLHSKIFEATATGQVSRRFDLPVLAMDQDFSRRPDHVLLSIALPCWRNDTKTLSPLDVNGVGNYCIFGSLYLSPNPLVPATIPLLAGLSCAAIAWLIAVRCGLPLWGRVLWAGIALPFGVVGLLGLLALREWPARVVCPACGKKRNVHRETCEHCGVTWPEPPRDGTEIMRDFETPQLSVGGAA